MTIFAVVLVDSRRGGGEVNIAAMTLLRDTSQKSRGKEPGRGVSVGNHVQPFVATQLFCRWQIPPCFLEGCRADWCSAVARKAPGASKLSPATPPFILRTFDEASNYGFCADGQDGRRCGVC